MVLRSNPGLVVLAVIFISQLVFAVGEQPPSVDQLIDNIARNEQIIQDISAKLVVTIPEEGDTFVEGEWGYSHGREYFAGTMYLYVSQLSKKLPQSFEFAFNGETMEIYRHDPIHDRHTGRITNLEPVNFTAYPTLNTLLGHDVHTSGRLSIAEALRQAGEVRVQPAMAVVNGHRCFVVEASEIEESPVTGVKGNDVRLWIDPERDYRILRIELYRNKPDPIRWKALVRRVDNIKLRQIDGVWIPVEGEFHNFRPRQVPAAGLTKEDIDKMTPEEALLNIDYELRPLVPMRLVKIDPESVSVGKEIPTEKFTIQWPRGTDVWDDFRQFGYKVGGPRVKASELEELLEGGEAKVLGPSGRDDAEHTSSSINEDRESATLPSTDAEIASSGGHGYWDVLISALVAAICCAGIALIIWKLRRRETDSK